MPLDYVKGFFSDFTSLNLHSPFSCPQLALSILSTLHLLPNILNNLYFNYSYYFCKPPPSCMLSKGQGACFFLFTDVILLLSTLSGTYWMCLCFGILILQMRKLQFRITVIPSLVEPGSEPRWFCFQSPFSSASNILPLTPLPPSPP